MVATFEFQNSILALTVVTNMTWSTKDHLKNVSSTVTGPVL